MCENAVYASIGLCARVLGVVVSTMLWGIILCKGYAAGAIKKEFKIRKMLLINPILKSSFKTMPYANPIPIAGYTFINLVWRLP